MNSLPPEAVLWVSLLGGALALDGTSFGQTMVSRPLVVATVTGAFAGAPTAGATLGLILEALQLTVLPVGASRIPESAPATAAGAAVYAYSSGAPFLLLSTVLFVLAWERIGGESVHGLRHLTGRLISDEPARHPARWLERKHLLAGLTDALRGVLLTAAGFLILSAAAPWLDRPTVVDELVPVLMSLTVAACVGALFTVVGRERWRMFAAGIVFGALLLVLP